MRQETLRIWDSGMRLDPGGEAVYLGLIAEELLVQRVMLFSYWSAWPAGDEKLRRLALEVGNLRLRRAAEDLLLIHSPQASPGS